MGLMLMCDALWFTFLSLNESRLISSCNMLTLFFFRLSELLCVYIIEICALSFCRLFACGNLSLLKLHCFFLKILRFIYGTLDQFCQNYVGIVATISPFMVVVAFKFGLFSQMYASICNGHVCKASRALY